MSIAVYFADGPAKGESLHWTGGDYVEWEPPLPPLDFSQPLEAVPDRVTVTRYVYRIDNERQPSGYFYARLVEGPK